jgi:hypothetical protein
MSDNGYVVVVIANGGVASVHGPLTRGGAQNVKWELQRQARARGGGLPFVEVKRLIHASEKEGVH